VSSAYSVAIFASSVVYRLFQENPFLPPHLLVLLLTFRTAHLVIITYTITTKTKQGFLWERCFENCLL